MALVQVNVIGLQALQTLVALVEDLLSGQSTVVGRRKRMVRQWPEQFGGQHVRLAWERGQGLANRQLCVTAVVLVGGVVEIDAQLPRLAVEVVALILLLSGKDQPRSKTHAGKYQSGIAKMFVSHRKSTCQSGNVEVRKHGFRNIHQGVASDHAGSHRESQPGMLLR